MSRAGRHLDGATEPTIRLCERRLALSASPGAAALLDLLGLANDPLDPADAAPHDLWSQAEYLRTSYGLDGSGQTVAVIDSGVAYDHIALGGGFGPGYRVVGGWDFAEDDADPYDDGPSGFHGSHVAGTISASGAGLTGIAPGADLVALRVFDDSGAGQMAWVEQALSWVLDNRSAFTHPITTINLSVGALLPDELAADVQSQLEDELGALRDAGIFVVAAAGNQYDAEHPDRLTYPASSPHVAAVTSTDATGALSSFAQRADGLLAATGRGVAGPVPEHVLGYDGIRDDAIEASGTSMAAPQVAAAGVLVRQALDAVGSPSDPNTLLARLTETADPQTDPDTGATYYQLNLKRAVDSLLADATAGETEGETPSPDPAGGSLGDPVAQVDVGAVDVADTVAGTDHWTLFRPQRTGTLSILLGPEGSAAADARLVVESVDGTPLAFAPVVPGQQIDLDVQADQPLRLRLDAALSASTPLRLVNLLSSDDSAVQLAGTLGDDAATIDLTDGVGVAVAGASYRFAAGQFSGVGIDLGAGNDALHVIGSDQSEKIELRVGEGHVTNSNVAVSFRGSETVAIDGRGGPNRAYLYDSSANDTLTMQPQRAELKGLGFHHSVASVDRVYVYASAGDDSAFLHDSGADDRLSIRPDALSLRSDAYFNRAFGFDRAYAYATAGGHDTAELYDSAGNDSLMANATTAWIRGPGYFSHARHFESVVAFANGGGDDVANLYAASTADRWLRAGDLVQLDSSDLNVRQVRGFESASTFVAGQAIEVQTLGRLDLCRSTDSGSLSDDRLDPPAEEFGSAAASDFSGGRVAALARHLEWFAATDPVANNLWMLRGAGREDEARDALLTVFAEHGS